MAGEVEVMMPQRVQRKRSKGWAMPLNTVYVGRPSRFGNPFTQPMPEDAVGLYRAWITGDSLSATTARRHLSALHGKNLACWCPLDQPCHADVLLELANAVAVGAEVVKR